MIESIVGVIDFLAFIVFIFSFFILIFKKRKLFGSISVFLMLFTLGYAFIFFLNFIQHFLSYDKLNPYEDYIAIIMILLFAFFIYADYLKEKVKEAEDSRKLFKTLVEDIPGIVYILKIEEKFSIYFISPHVENYTGYKPEDFYENPSLWDSYIVEEDRNKIYEKYREIVKSRKNMSIEYRIKLKDGNLHWFKDNIRLFYRNEKPYILGISTDITNEKKNAEALDNKNRELKRKISSLEKINELSERLRGVTKPEEIMRASVEIMKGYLGEPSISIFKVSWDEGVLELVYSYGFSKEIVEIAKEIPLKGSRSGRTSKEKKVILITDIEKDEIMAPHIKRALLKEGFQSVILLPLISKDKAVGIMHLIYKGKIDIDKDERNAIESIGKTIGLALENAYNLENLTESEQKYRTLAESAEDFIIIHNIEGKIEYINSSALKASGLKREDVVGRDIRDFLPEEELLKLEERLNKRKKGDYSSFKFYTYFEGKDGTRIDMEVISTPIIKEGEIESILIIARDISERLAYEKKLLTLSLVVEQTNTSIFITDEEGRIEYVNPYFEELTGYSFDEVKGKKPKFLKSGKHDKSFYENLWKTVLKGEIWRGDIINKKKDGSLYYARSTIFPIKDKDNKIINFAAIELDITKEKKLEEQSKQIQRLEAIGSLAVGIAHDFNNLLTSILGYTDLLPRDLSGNKKALKKVINIKKASESARDLVSKLLAYSRKQVIKPKVISINRALLELKDMLKRIVSEDIELIFNLQEDIEKIYADKTQIEQIVMNLVANSRDAILSSKKKEKKILIETEQIVITKDYVKTHLGSSEGTYALLKITDTGIGMDKETMNKIFEPFFTTKEPKKGTGLGLSTVYGIVKQNNGFIYAYSELGKGTTIKIYWPVCKGEVDNKGKDKEFREEIIEKEIKFEGNALIVEDDEGVLKVGKEFLSSFGFNVFSANNGIEALKIVEKIDNLKLVLSDVVMPKMDGLEFYEKVIKIKGEIKFIFSSGYPLTHPEISKKINGDVAFLQKPYTLNEFRKVLIKLFS